MCVWRGLVQVHQDAVEATVVVGPVGDAGVGGVVLAGVVPQRLVVVVVSLFLHSQLGSSLSVIGIHLVVWTVLKDARFGQLPSSPVHSPYESGRPLTGTRLLHELRFASSSWLPRSYAAAVVVVVVVVETDVPVRADVD